MNTIKTLRKKLVKLKNDNPYLKLLWFKHLARRASKAESIPDREWIEIAFERTFGRKPDLDNPNTFYEKINWLKLNYRNSIMPIVSDKYLVHQYLKNNGYSELLNDLIGVWDNANDFCADKLPDKFVLKASHASGTAWSLIVKDKNNVNWNATRMVMRQWLKQKIDWMGREWHYGEMKPRIICEKYLEDESGELRDYKFHCFGGVPRYVNVCIGRFTKHKQFLCFDRNWNLLPFTNDALNLSNDFNLERPKNIDRMFELASELSKGFPYVRVDFYNVNGKIYFGEFTFFDFSGFASPYTDEAQRVIGSWLTLPEANHR